MRRETGWMCSVEGLWHVGKTTLCRYLAASFSESILIEEPDHMGQDPRPLDVQLWYLQQWLTKTRAAAAYRAQGRYVFMERSFLSTVAYMEAVERPMSPAIESALQDLLPFAPDFTVFLDADNDWCRGLSYTLLRAYREAGVALDDSDFVSRYRGTLLNLLARNGVTNVVLSVEHGRSRLLFDAVASLIKQFPAARQRRAPS